jgi:hypothetical protein
MLALMSDQQRAWASLPWEAMTKIPFQKLVTSAYNLHTGRAQTFAITGAGSISISLSRSHTRDIKIEIFAPHPRQDRSPKMSPCGLRALDYVTHRPPNHKPFNPEHLLPAQRKKAFAVRLHRGHLVLAVGAACRCSRSNIGWKVRYVVRGNGPGCFHTVPTRQYRRHMPR